MVEMRKVNNLSEMVFYFIICQTDHSPRNTFVVRKQRIRNEHRIHTVYRKWTWPLGIFNTLA